MKRKTRLLSLLLCCVLVLGLLPVTALADDGDVEINETNFPDSRFREVYVRTYDTNGDGVLSAAEIAAVTEIDCCYRSISSLQGIEYFTALTHLWCGGISLTSLDVSKNTALEGLGCWDNQLTSLDVSSNTALTHLNCDGNQLTSLDVAANTKLTDLSCSANQLTSLDVSSNTVLGRLYCAGNQLTSLDLSKNTALAYLHCYNNELTSLDLSKNTALRGIVSNGNERRITVDESRTFDLSTLPGSFDVSKASEWDGGTVSGNILTVDADKDVVTYTYETGYENVLFTLNVVEHTHNYTRNHDTENHWLECDGEDCPRPIKDEEAHTYGDWTETKPATHTEKGEKEHTCTVCDYIQTEEIPEIQHSFDVKYDTEMHWRECACGAKQNERVHSFSDWTVTKAATTTAKGEKQRACTVCDYTETAEIPMVVTPPTGDNTNLLLWTVLLFTGAMGVAVTAVYGKKKACGK